MGDKKNIVLDTNVFMENLDVVEELMHEYKIYIPYIVLQELDHHKDRGDSTRSYKGRTAIKFINANYDEFEFIETENSVDNNDDLILQTAKDNRCAIATYDICMKVKCKALDIPLVELNNDKKEYKGYKIVEIDTNEDDDNQWLANVYEKPQENPCELLTNEYLIIRDKANPIWDSDEFNHKIGYKTIDIFRWDGNELVGLRLPPKKVVRPLNDLQTCALDLLMDKDIPIKIVAGEYGSGKTLISTLVGLYMVEDKGQYSKLVLVRNNDLQDSGRDVGALPGDLLDKTNLLFKTSIQHFPQGEYQAEKMRMEGKLETHITYFIKGLSINGYVIVDESEDLTLKDIKLVGSRIEEDASIVFAGDWKQANGKYKNDNGLIQLINKTKDNPLVGVVVLDEDVRSDASKVFADLM